MESLSASRLQELSVCLLIVGIEGGATKYQLEAKL